MLRVENEPLNKKVEMLEMKLHHIQNEIRRDNGRILMGDQTHQVAIWKFRICTCFACSKYHIQFYNGASRSTIFCTRKINEVGGQKNLCASGWCHAYTHVVHLIIQLLHGTYKCQLVQWEEYYKKQTKDLKIFLSLQHSAVTVYVKRQ